MLAGILLGLSANSAVQQWAGTLTFPPYVADSALNITVDTAAATATVAWVYDHNGAGQKCVPDGEVGLKVEVDGSAVTFVGTGKDPTYYGFAGKLSADGKTLAGSMTGPGVGTASKFSVTLGAEQVPATCTPPGPPPTPKNNPSIWPMPSSFTNGDTVATVAFSPDFFKLATASPILTTAIARYEALTFPHDLGTSSSPSGVTGLTITVASTAEDFPQLGMSENYTLTIPTSGVATLDADSVWGAMHGLETFSQLVAMDFDTPAYTVPNAPWTIADAPRFPHRGLMIDTARHFEPLDAIKKMIDSLPYAKLNVLHWHMSDSQSFPLQVMSSPKLWSGSWSGQERYLQSDVRDVVEYARTRGECSFMYRYILRESCSQFDSLPLTSLTISPSTLSRRPCLCRV
jgi:hexosaminidase